MKLSRRTLPGIVVLIAVLVLAAAGWVNSYLSGILAQSWGFTVPFAILDRAAAQRGFQIYAEACANCHSMNYLHYRDLSGIGLSESQIKDVAASVTVPVGFDNQGNVVTKAGTPASQFQAPFVSEEAARDVLNGAYPPDLSLMLNTFPNGANYVYALLTGYADPPADTKLANE